MNLNEYNALRRVTDAVRAADSAFCEDFYNNEPFTILFQKVCLS